MGRAAPATSRDASRRTKTDEGYNVDKTLTTDSGASKTVSKDVNVEDREVQTELDDHQQVGRVGDARDARVEGEGGYATIEGSDEDEHGPRSVGRSGRRAGPSTGSRPSRAR
ncbi:MAG: hypothetical protein MZV65_53160 [Chromatiales bacterium]|nr:hypothetical protein [Chromatiales bacterium]